jgi:hypothetical protein
MNDDGEYIVALFKSVSEVMKAESLLKGTEVSFKLIPIPKKISPDCGVCIRFMNKDRMMIEQILNEKVCVVEFVIYK